MLKKILIMIGIELLTIGVFRAVGIISAFIVRFSLDSRIVELITNKQPSDELKRLQATSLFFSGNLYLLLWILVGVFVGLYFINRYWVKHSES